MMRGILDLPDELLAQIDGQLTFEDSVSFTQSARRLRKACEGKMMMFDKIQISDDASECRVTDSRCRRQPLTFRPESAARVIATTSHLKEIGILMKEVELTRALQGTERSPFSPGGYLGPLLYRNQHALTHLKQLTLHVDIMVETIKNQHIPCPVQDLSFALQFLANAEFDTFIQISACCAQYHEADSASRDLLISEMQQTLKIAAGMGANPEFVVEPTEGYVDMTIEKGRLEYSFAFFYYNPSICEAAPAHNPFDGVIQGGAAPASPKLAAASRKHAVST